MRDMVGDAKQFIDWKVVDRNKCDVIAEDDQSYSEYSKGSET